MHVGLIALSGVRVVNDDLASAGLTLPGFVSRGEVIVEKQSFTGRAGRGRFLRRKSRFDDQ